MNNKMSNGMVLETDPKILRMFPTQVPTDEQFAAKQADYVRRFDNESYVFDVDGNVKPQSKCVWGNSHLARFINRYVHFYKSKSKDRAFILEQLRSVAAENNIRLPSPSEMDKRQPKKRLVSEMVDITRYENGNDYRQKYKVYYDGENTVAYLPNENKARDRHVYERTKWDDLFDILYPLLREQYGIKSDDKIGRTGLEGVLIRQFYELYDYDDNAERETCPEFINRKLYNKSAAFSERRKRFYRKKDQVRWTAWWTITYDDKKFRDEQCFKFKLLNKFRNLSDKNGWRIMGVFEHGGKNNRLHFHGFFYIPQGSEVGELVDSHHWSEKEHCMHYYKENTEFKKKFGINEYEDISEATQKDIHAFAKYTAKMLRYMEKGEKVYYSRHIPTEFEIEMRKSDMLVAYNITCKRPVRRYVVNDNFIIRSDIGLKRKDFNDPVDIGLLDAV